MSGSVSALFLQTGRFFALNKTNPHCTFFSLHPSLLAMSWKQLHFSKTKWGPAIVRPPSDSHRGSPTNEDITVQPSERCWIMYELSLDALGSSASLPDIVSAGAIGLERTWKPQCGCPVATPGQHRGARWVSEPGAHWILPLWAVSSPWGWCRRGRKAPQASVLVPLLWCLPLWSLHNGLAWATNPVWLSSDLYFHGWL